jgi:hypothetical protein
MSTIEDSVRATKVEVAQKKRDLVGLPPVECATAMLAIETKTKETIAS